MTKLTLADLSLKDQRVLMRVDFNVPLKDDGSIADDSRIASALPSIRYCLNHGASVVLMSHIGRPKGKKDPKATLAPCAKRLSELLKVPVALAPDSTGPAVEHLAHHLKSGQVLLLENLRFHIGEEEPDLEPEFVKNLATLGTVYVNDAFGTAHRAHASTALITKFFPHKAAMGLLIQKEVSFLEPLLHNPKRPFYAIIGGAKVSSKAGVVQHLQTKLDALFIGGGMAFPFFKALSMPVGNSLCEEKDIPIALAILQTAKQKSLKLYLPLDTVAEKAGHEPSLFEYGVPEGWAGMDIGPKTIDFWTKELAGAATIFWNGPLGVFEKPPFDQGTRKIATILASLQAQVIVGGGDSIAAIKQIGLEDRFTHLSTGGGASLEFLEFGHLPGIEALSDK